jgi:glycosyltransferase involved in cell wall biosynthesis
MHLKPNKKISIIIPTKNGSKYVWAAVDSVLSQVYDDMELIVSVNHSNDQTLLILKKLRDARLRILVPPEPLTMVEHYEWCISQSRGEWIAVIGDDDGLMPFFFKEFENLIKKWKKEVDVFNFRRAYYFWPGCDKLCNKYEIYIKSQKREKRISGIILLFRALFLDLNHFDLPQIYTNNIIKRKLLYNIKKRSGNKIFHEPNPDIYSGVAISLLSKKIIRSENSIFWTGTSPKSIGLKAKINNNAKILFDFKKKNNYSFKISEEIGVDSWNFILSNTLFTLSCLYNIPFCIHKIQKYKKILMLLSAPRIYNEIHFNFYKKDNIYKKKIVLFKNMLKKNNLLNFLILIKFASKVIKTILLLSKFFSYISDAFYKFEYKIIIRKKNKSKVKNLIIANRLLI